uniref:Uncharacterized protein n=1 Tax=Cacopsylla melanoneura TaxID=428564 RepID=A0A8D8SKN2_9HEMI
MFPKSLEITTMNLGRSKAHNHYLRHHFPSLLQLSERNYYSRIYKRFQVGLETDFLNLIGQYYCTMANQIQKVRLKSDLKRSYHCIKTASYHCIKTALLKNCKNNIGPSPWERFICNL